MNIDLFDKHLASLKAGRLSQQYEEWRAYMTFVWAYFRTRGIISPPPIVVEIGLWRMAQKNFYTQFIGAEYIGIDISTAKCQPDIVGDSHAPETYEALLKKLAGRKIDLLFIDADHDYEPAKKDYDMYAPLAKHLIVLHDINGPKGCSKVWQNLVKENTTDTFINFHHATHLTTMGIGVQILNDNRNW